MIPGKPFQVKAVLFDFDGTLTEPGALDFSSIRQAIGCPAEQPILEYIAGLNDAQRRRQVQAELVRFEIEASAKSVPNAEAEEIIPYLRARGLRVGILSRNGLGAIMRALQNFRKLRAADFDMIISRDDPVRPKPNADGILLAAAKFGVSAAQVLMVGDYIFDIQAGQNAGAVTVFLDNRAEKAPSMPASDYTISNLIELKRLVRLGLPLLPGKLPNELLESFLGRLITRAPSILVHPGIGEDTTAVDVENEEVIVLKSDPITFVADNIGQYAVLINANDIATSGARPRWFLTSLLFPCETTPSQIWQVMQEIEAVCRQSGISLCGGHTEITDAVTRPVVTGMLVGTVARKDLLEKRDIRKGDIVLLTKAVAVEGTAIIAAEFGARLEMLGMSAAEVRVCREFLSGISVLKEAQIAAATRGVVAMHDVTEGGLAAALAELSVAGGHEIRVDMDQIPVFAETGRICRLLDLDPLGLIGSGSLLICCRKKARSLLLKRIQAAGIRITAIGEIGAAGRGVQTQRQGAPVDWPSFEVDEITRLYRPAQP